MAIKNVVFDLGGVLVDWNPRYLYQKVFETDQEVDYFLTHICNHEWNVQQDAGRTMEEATAILVQKHPKYQEAIRLYYQRWTEMFSGHIQGSLDILTEIEHNKQHRLLALTNWSGETFPTARKLFPFLSLFEGIVVSGDEKLIKPDPEIYQVLFNRYDVNPGESVFIDDSKPNVDAAYNLGMKAIHFQGPNNLRNELTSLDVL